MADNDCLDVYKLIGGGTCRVWQDAWSARQQLHKAPESSQSIQKWVHCMETYVSIRIAFSMSDWSGHSHVHLCGKVETICV